MVLCKLPSSTPLKNVINVIKNLIKHINRKKNNFFLKNKIFLKKSLSLWKNKIKL